MPFDTELVNKSEFKYVIFSFFPEVLKHSIWTVDIRTIQILNYCQLNFILRPKIYIQQNKSNLLFCYNLYVFIMCPVMRIENRLVTIRTILIHIEFGPRRPLIHVCIIQGLDQVKPNYPLIDAACFFLLQVFETEPRALNMVLFFHCAIARLLFWKHLLFLLQKCLWTYSARLSCACSFTAARPSCLLLCKEESVVPSLTFSLSPLPFLDQPSTPQKPGVIQMQQV